MTALLRFDGIALRRGGRLLFEDLDLAIGTGEALQVVGPNGSGKSSLIRLAAGLLRQSAAGSSDPRSALADDQPALDRELPLGRALSFWGGPPEPALEALGIAHLAGVPVRLLSSGQLKRATLARAAASRRAVVAARRAAQRARQRRCRAAGEAASRTHRAAGGAVLAASHQPLAGDWARLELGAVIGSLIARRCPPRFDRRAWLPVAFFLLVVALIPFAVGPDAKLLGVHGPGVLWIAALTAALLPIERLIEPDRADGMLDQLVVHGMAEEIIAFAKIAAHWLTFGPLLLDRRDTRLGPAGHGRASLVRTEIALAIGIAGLASARRRSRRGNRRACRAQARLPGCCCCRSPSRC